MTLGYDQPLYLLAFDHRGSFETGGAAVRGCSGVGGVPEAVVGGGGRGEGELDPADAKHSGEAGFTKVDAADIGDAHFVRDPTDDAVFDADAFIRHGVAAPATVDLHPAYEEQDDKEEGKADAPEDEAEVGQGEEEAGPQSSKQDEDEEPFAGVMHVRNGAGPKGLF